MSGQKDFRDCRVVNLQGFQNHLGEISLSDLTLCSSLSGIFLYSSAEHLLSFSPKYIVFISSRIFWCDFCIFVKLLVLFMYCFPDFIELPFCVLFCLFVFVAHWVSLKQLSWIFNWVNHRSPCFCLQFPEGYCGLFVVSCYLDFLIFCDVLHCCLCIWSSSHLFKSLLTAFGRKITSVNPARESVATSDLLWVHLLHLLAPFVAELLSLCAFFGSCNTPAWVLTASLRFPKGGAKAQVCNLSLTWRFRWFYLCAHWPPAKDHSCCHHQECA